MCRCEGTETCSAQYTWTAVAFSNFSEPAPGIWTGTNAHACGDVGVQECGALGRVLGGDRQLLAGSGLRGFVQELPEHSLLRVRLTLVLIDAWQGDRVVVDVDGRTVYRSPPIAHTAESSQTLSQECGSDTEVCVCLCACLCVCVCVHVRVRVPLSLCITS